MVRVLVAVLLLAGAGAPVEGEWKELVGTIRHIDHQKKSIAVEMPLEQGKKLILQIEPSTTILIDGQLSALDELPRNAEVRASFREGRALRHVQWIEVQRAEAQRPVPQDPRDKARKPAAPTPVAPR